MLVDDDDVRLARFARDMKTGVAAIGQQRARRPPRLPPQIDIGAELLGHLYRLAGLTGIRHRPIDRCRSGLMRLAHRKVMREAARVEQYPMACLNLALAV